MSDEATSPLITITNRWNGSPIHQSKATSIKEAVKDAIANKVVLRGADLRGADLRDADLRGADLRGADLRVADLRDADLRDADLRGADLRGAVLRDADLSGAVLRGAVLRDADLSGAKLSDLQMARLTILPAGHIIGWKKCRQGMLVKLAILPETRRSNSTTRKCRAEAVETLEIIDRNGQPADVAYSQYDDQFAYRVGETQRCHVWNEDRWTECGGGIHFFITREEAEAF